MILRTFIINLLLFLLNLDSAIDTNLPLKNPKKAMWWMEQKGVFFFFPSLTYKFCRDHKNNNKLNNNNKNNNTNPNPNMIR